MNAYNDFMLSFVLFTVKSASSKPKPAGTDDGFKGEGAACGTSIVKVSFTNSHYKEYLKVYCEGNLTIIAN